jgi:hypothetical protein
MSRFFNVIEFANTTIVGEDFGGVGFWICRKKKTHNYLAFDNKAMPFSVRRTTFILPVLVVS